MSLIKGPLSYAGVESPNPPNFIRHDRAPLEKDYRTFNIGDIWSEKNTNNVWLLTDKKVNVATWTTISATGTGIFETIEITDGPFVLDYFTTPGVLVNGATGIVSSLPGNSEQIIIGVTDSAPVWGNLSSTGGSVTITYPDATTINLEAAGGGGLVSTFALDDLSSVGPTVGGVINLINGSNIETTGTPLDNEIQINLTTAAAGKVLIGAGVGSDAIWNYITPGVGITIVEAAGVIELSSTKLTINEQVGVSYILALNDAGKEIKMTNLANNVVTIPINTDIAFAIGTIIGIFQYGAGETSVAPAAGVTMRSPDGRDTLYEQYSTCALIKLDTDEWQLLGDIK